MTLIQLIVLALIQGATEWLPVSSSAHLMLFPHVTGLPDQGPLIDAMAHLGSLGAVLIYFRRDIARMMEGMVQTITGAAFRGSMSPEAKLFLLVVVATPPGLIAGAIYQLTDLKEILRSPAVIAAATIGFAIALWAADHFASRTKTEAGFTFKDAIVIGLAQALAFIPGASRSGVAMTAARAMGFAREEAARFAMLAGIPLIGAVGAFALLQLALGADASAVAADGTRIPVTLMDGLIVAGLSFLAAWASVAVLMALVKRMSFLPFVLYRFALGAVLLIFFV